MSRNLLYSEAPWRWLTKHPQALLPQDQLCTCPVVPGWQLPGECSQGKNAAGVGEVCDASEAWAGEGYSVASVHVSVDKASRIARPKVSSAGGLLHFQG